ncbi:unnamed protein product [Cunninghamella blakesleeana]
MILQYLVYNEESLNENNSSNTMDTSFVAIKMKAAKCWCSLLEHLSKLNNQDINKGTVKAILKDIKLKRSHIQVMIWVTSVTQKEMSPFIQHSATDKSLMLARHYCLRGLNAHLLFFGSDLIEHYAYQRLLLRPLAYYFGDNFEHFSSMESMVYSSKQQQLQQENDDDGRHLLSFCNTAAQFLDNLIKSEKDIGVNNDNKNGWEQYIKGSSTNCLSLIKVWVGASFILIKNGSIINSSIKEVSQIFYYLTVIVSKMSTDSGIYAYLVPNINQQLNDNHNSNQPTFKCLWTWHRVFPLLLSQLIYRLQMNIQNNDDIDNKSYKRTSILISPYNTSLLTRILVNICNILWKCHQYVKNNYKSSHIAESCFNNNQTFSEMITGYTTNFLLAFTAHPIPIDMIGIMAFNDNEDNHISLLPMTLTADVVIRGYFGLTSRCIENHHSILIPILETLIQYSPLIRKSWRLSIGSKLAWSIKSLLSLLDADGLLDDSPLLSRIEKLIIYLLHDDDAIDQLADCTNGLDKYIWDPTIQLARNGLLTATSAINDIYLSSPKDVYQSLEKGKRALMALEKITNHSRACERLADTNILSLMDSIVLSTINPLNDYHHPLTLDQVSLFVRSWTVYALFTRLLATLAGRTSLLRSKLRQENRLIHSIMKLLWYTHQFECTFFLKQSKEVILTCQYVVNGCLQIINAYRYDKQAIQEWMYWKYDTIDNNEMSEKEGGDDENNITLIKMLLSVIIPWRNKRNITDYNIGQWWMIFNNQICLASMILESLSQYDECGKQLIESNDGALYDISKWMVSITNIVNHGIDNLDNNNSNNSDNIINNQIDDKLLNGYVVNNDQGLLLCDNNNNNSTTTTAAQFDEDEIIEDVDYNLNNDDHDIEGENNEENINTTMLSIINLKLKNNQSTKSIIPTSLNEHCLLPLSRCLTKIITHLRNLKSLIMYDGFTQIFAPFIYEIKKNSSNSSTWLTMTQQLYQALYSRIDDLERLINFYDQNDKDIKRRHELSAIAMVYATCWKQEYWLSKLGILNYDTTKEAIVYSTCHFGLICHMLTMNFDENMNNNNNNNNNNKNDNDDDHIIFQSGNFQQRRTVAAQALTILIIPYQAMWEKKLDEDISTHKSLLNQLLLKQIDNNNDHQIPTLKDKIKESVLLRTDDSLDPIKTNYGVLTQSSAAFKAMLSNHYAESDYVYLHDIPMTSLKHYIYVNEHLISSQQQQTILNGWQWEDIIELTQVADRYSNHAVQLLCEIWILEQMKHQPDGYLSGCLYTYLNLRSKYQHHDGGGLLSSTWPYHIILCQCIKTMLSNLLDLINTDSFQQFTNHNDDSSLENIEDFCNAIYIFFNNPLL